MSRIDVLIAVDHWFARRVLADRLEEYEELHVVGVARDGVEALEMVIQHRPQVLVLDVLMPRMNGFALIDQLQRITDIPHPAIIALSTPEKESVVRCALNMCVSYHLVKPVGADLLAQCAIAAGGGSHPGGRNGWKPRGADDLGQEILMQLGVPANLLGYQCLRCALRESCTNEEMLQPLSRKLYARVAQMQGISEKSVERAIRYAIAQAWSRGGAEKYRQLLGRNGSIVGDKPTNSEFLVQVTEWLRAKLRQQ